MLMNGPCQLILSLGKRIRTHAVNCDGHVQVRTLLVPPDDLFRNTNKPSTGMGSQLKSSDGFGLWVMMMRASGL